MSGNGVEALIPVPKGPRWPSGCPSRQHVPTHGLVAPSETSHFSRMVNEDADPGDVRTGRGDVTWRMNRERGCETAEAISCESHEE